MCCRQPRGVSPGYPCRVLHEVAVRQGGPQDTGVLIDLFDDAVAWLVARGQPEQWGSEPFSRRADGRRRARDLAAGGGLFVAQNRQEPVGLLVVGDAPEYAPAIDRPELYIELLLTARRHAGNALGTRLIDVAIREARAAKREVVRVDCWAGAPKLVNWYEQQGVHANRSL
jgi:GNAT superfamily N-acetyltransferase